MTTAAVPASAAKAMIVEHPSARPTLRCRPARVVGIPVARATFCLSDDIPKARLGEKEKPNLRRLPMHVLL